MKYANNGKSVICGEWTSKMKTHFKVSIAHCSDNEPFDKMEGKQISRSRMSEGHFIVLPAKSDGWESLGLKEQLKDFLYVNCY
jgi:hypothetical protein